MALRRIVAFIAVVVSAVASFGAPASAAAPEQLLCDLSGPVRIEKIEIFHSPNISSYYYRWFIDASGTCVEQSGARHDIWISLETDRLVGAGPVGGPCNNVTDPTGAFEKRFSGYGAMLGRPFFVFRMTWAALPVSSYTPITVEGGLANPDGPIDSYVGDGVQANRVFLQCPSTFPQSSNGRFVFTLDHYG